MSAGMISNKRGCKRIISNNIDYPVIKLLQIYKSRIDLQKAFPEVMDGNIKRLLEWVLKSGLTIDSSKKDLIEYKDYYSTHFNQNPDSLKFKIPRGLLTDEQTIWDNSKEQYIPGGFKIYWEALDKIARYQYECASGDPNVDFVDFSINLLKKACFPRNLKCCIIGCDEIGKPEIKFYKSCLFDEIVVMDIARGLLSKQQALAEYEGFSNIKYVCADFNSFELKENYFDLIFACGTVHHIEKLEHFFLQVQRSLKSSGFFTMREYVGPNRIQLIDAQLDLTNSLLKILPAKYKILPDGRIKEEQTRPNLEEIIKIDPSESIRSEEIMDIMKNYLEIVLFCPTGGTLLHPLLNGIAGNFERDKEGERLLGALIELERILINSKLLPSDYVFVVAKSKKAKLRSHNQFVKREEIGNVQIASGREEKKKKRIWNYVGKERNAKGVDPEKLKDEIYKAIKKDYRMKISKKNLKHLRNMVEKVIDKHK